MHSELNRRVKPARILTIAGSDSGGGAGIQADLKTCTALGCYGMTAITAITAQNTLGVRAIHEVPAPCVRDQIAAVFEDIGVDAVKTGMLSSEAIIEAVADGLRRYKSAPVVVDPVMISKSGAALLKQDAVEALKRLLLPLSTVLSPNIPEAEVLSGIRIETAEEITRALHILHGMGPEFVLLKGGHLQAETAVDYLFDGDTITTFTAERLQTVHTHGTGCTYSAAIACFLGLGESVPRAVHLAKNYLTCAILHGMHLGLGSGTGPLHHGWNLETDINTGKIKQDS